MVFLAALGLGGAGVTEWLCTTQGGGWGWKNQGDLTGNRFQVIVSLFTYGNGGKVRSGYLGGIFGCFAALRGPPVVADG